MQIFKWMPLKAEEQNLLSETITLTTPQADNNCKDSNDAKMSNNNNPILETATSNSNNKPTTNGTNHSTSLGVKENNITVSHHNNSPQQLNDLEPPSDSPPAKRIKTSSIETIDDQEMDAVASTSLPIPIKVEEPYSATPVEEEPPKYNELRQVGRSTPTLTESCHFAVPTPPPTSSVSIEEADFKKTASNVSQTDTSTLQHVNTALLTKISEQPSVEMSLTSEETLMEVAESYTKESQQSTSDTNVEMEDFSSVVRLVTDQIVTQVSDAQDTSSF